MNHHRKNEKSDRKVKKTQKNQQDTEFAFYPRKYYNYYSWTKSLPENKNFGVVSNSKEPETESNVPRA